MEKTTKIDRFTGGTSNDPRDSRKNVGRFITGFDIYTSPRKLIPYKDSAVGDDNAATRRKRNFQVALTSGVTYSIYGLGVSSAVTGASRGVVEYMSLGALGSTWTAMTNGTASADYSTLFNCFVYYQKAARIYGFAIFQTGGLRIYAVDPADATAIAEDVFSAGTLSGTGINSTVAQGLIHSKDGFLYLPYDNKIAQHDGTSATTTFTAAALTLPSHLVITSICEYGNYIAIGCANKNGVGNSKVFLWDRQLALTGLDESIDWGSGTLIVLDQVDGELIGISQKGGNGGDFSYSVGVSGQTPLVIPKNTISNIPDKVVFRRLIGNVSKKIFEIQADRSGGFNTTRIPAHKQVVDSRLLFQMIIRYNGAVRDGVWSIGRSDFTGEFTLVQERSSNANTAITTGDSVNGFIQVGDFVYQTFTSGGSGATWNTRKTVDSSDTSYSDNAIFITKVYDGSEHGFSAAYYKSLKEVSITTEGMVTNGSVQVDYQTDVDMDTGADSWTTIFTHTTNGSLSHTANNIESSSAALPKKYKEIQFRIISTGGASITGFEFKEDITSKRYTSD